MSAALALAVALAMDATAVAAARGAGPASTRDGVTLALLFGLFQAGMAALGWLGGAAVGTWIARWDHWIAFVLLGALGVRMIVEARRGGGDDEADTPRPGSLGLYLALAVATSIDAAAAGVTLPLLPVAPWITLVAIGVVTAALSGAGYAFARQLGARIGRHLELVGGLALIGIGTKILIEHLGAG